MALPGHRSTSSHKRRRASHFALSPAPLTTCPQCKKPVRPHCACVFCGTYRGKKILAIKTQTSKSKK